MPLCRYCNQPCPAHKMRDGRCDRVPHGWPDKFTCAEQYDRFQSFWQSTNRAAWLRAAAIEREAA